MMKNRTLWILWLGLYVACTLLSIVANPQGIVFAALLLLGMAFFVPPVILVLRAFREKNRKTLRLIRNLSLASLILTVALILMNFLTVQASATAGTILFVLLILVSCPMVCTQIWLIILFGWAFLLMASITYLKQK